MSGAIANLVHWFNPWAITGPVLGKELRVASRRRRHFWLRFCYLTLLSFFVLVVYADRTVGRTGADVAYALSQAGQQIALTISWFQFVILPLVAVVLLSSSISDEVYHRTLPALLSAPISPTQIVLGKLLAKFMQLGGLMLAGVPVLALMQVLGGVPWGYVVSSTCLTLTTILLVSAVTILFSVLCRRPGQVVVLTLVSLFVVFGVLFWLIGYILFSGLRGADKTLMMAYLELNPVAVMVSLAVELENPGAMGWAGSSSGIMIGWIVHCVVMVGVSAVLLIPSIRMVRKVALMRAMGLGGVGKDHLAAIPPRVAVPLVPAAANAAAVANDPLAIVPLSPAEPGLQPGHCLQANSATQREGRIRPVTGNPLVWKEVSAYRARWSVGKIIVLVLLIIIGLVMYGVLAHEDALKRGATQGVIVAILMALAGLDTAVTAAGMIASERESRTLDILLTTPLQCGAIIWAKLLGVLRRCRVTWSLVGIHLLLFTIGGVLHPVVLLLMPLTAGALFMIAAGLGIFCSSCLRRTSTAVVVTLVGLLAIWVGLPVVMETMFQLRGNSPRQDYEMRDVVEAICIDGSPIPQSFILATGSSLREREWPYYSGYNSGPGRDYYRWATGAGSTAGAFGVAFATFIVYSLVGIFLLTAASRRRRLARHLM